MHVARLKLDRIVTSGNFLPEVDGLRFIAISSVVAFHLLAQLGRYYGGFASQVPLFFRIPIQNGDRGVRLFFVISGFILALPFAKHHLLDAPAVSLRRYFLRRLTRLEPPYLLSLVVFSMLIWLFNHTGWNELIPHLAASSLYLHNIVYGSFSTINIVAWSLEVEVQFYILVPLLTMLFALRGAKVRRIMLASAIAAAGLLQTLAPALMSLRVTLSVLYYVQFFLTGFLLADIYILSRQSTRSFRWDLIGGAAALSFFLVPAAGIQLTGPVLVFLLGCAALRGQIANRVLRNPFLVTVGGMCYSIYLTHFVLIALATRMAPGHPLLMICLSVLAISVVSTLYFVLIERPCMRPDWPIDVARWFRTYDSLVPSPRP